MTTDEALTRVRRSLNETTAAFWSDAEIYGYLTEAETILAGKLGGVQASTAHTTVTDTSAYTKPTGCLRIDRVTYDGKKLRRGTYRDRDMLDGTNYGSVLQTGQPEMYTEWASQIVLWPVPQSAASLSYFFRKTPTTITNATSFSFQEESIQALFPNYAVAQALLKDGEVARADRYLGLWNSGVSQAVSVWQDRDTQDSYGHVKDEDEYPGQMLGMD